MPKLIPLRPYFDLQEILPATSPKVYILNEKHAAVLRRLLVYLRQRASWLSVRYNNGYGEYVDDQTLDAIKDEVDKMDAYLSMPVELNNIADALNAIANCLCKMSNRVQIDYAKAIQDAGGQVGSSIKMDDILPQYKELGDCNAANLLYSGAVGAVNFFFTILDITTDILGVTNILASSLAVLTGGIGIPVWVLEIIAAALVELAEETIRNWFLQSLINSKEEIICALYKDISSESDDFTETRKAIKRYSGPEAGLLIILFTSAWGLAVIKKGVQLGIFKADQTPFDCENCQDEQQIAITLDGRYGSGDFVGQNDEGYYWQNWPTWFASRQFDLETSGEYLIEIKPRYGCQRVRVYQFGYMQGEYDAEDLGNGIYQLTVSLQAAPTALEFKPSASVYWVKVKKLY